MRITTCKSEGEAVSNEGDQSAWEDFISSAPTATVSHHYGWGKIISAAYGHQTVYLAARREREITGILPLVHVKSRLFGSVLTSMPFQDYGGIVAVDDISAQMLLDRALCLRKDLDVDSIELRHRAPFLFNEGMVRRDKATLVLDISKGPESLWKSFSPKLRNQIRKAQKSGLHTQSGGIELLQAFYAPFASNMRDLGSPVHHVKFFDRILSEFGNIARLLIVREGPKAVGGLCSLQFKDTFIVPWASSFRQYFNKCPNNLLYWDAIQQACAAGCRFFDFGRSTIGSGTYKFKLQWGAVPIPLHWQIYPAPGRSVAHQGEKTQFRMASALWKHLPYSLATFAGPYFRKYLTN